MHELSIVRNIIGIVSKEAEKSGARRIIEVQLEIGELSGIEFESLDFAFKNLAGGSLIETAKILIDKPKGRAVCKNCRNEFDIEKFIGSCDRCNSFDLDIIKGRELKIKSITI